MVRFLKSYAIEFLILVIFGAFLFMLTAGIPVMLEFHELASRLGKQLRPDLQNAFTIFLSIFVEGLPFILMGVFLSAMIHQYVNEEMILKYVPKNPLIALPIAACLGLLLPICECGIVPVARRLIQKGLPTYIAFTFLLAAPVINPITIGSTYLAFGDDWTITFQRVGIAAIIAIIMGICFMIFFRKHSVLKKDKMSGTCIDGCDHDHDRHEKPSSRSKQFSEALHHAIFEFIDMGKYFVLGGLLAAFFHVFVGITAIKNFAENEFLAVFVMMLLAFGLSICSSADAFVASSFRQVIPTAPILAFLIYGPVMDLKNLFMMWGSFRPAAVGFFFAGTTVLTILSILFIL